MPSYRLLHANYRTGKKSKKLTELELVVWVFGYMQCADDFGVCPASAQKLQGDDPWLAKRPRSLVQRAIETLIGVGLIGWFEDGDERYLYQPDWQDWQNIKHPSKTTRPPIPSELLEKCSPKTQTFFLEFHPKRSTLVSLHARACDANANATASASMEGVQGKPHPIKAFLAEHERLFVAKYREKPAKYTSKDFKHAKDLTEAYGPRALALLGQFFASVDPFVVRSGHGLGVLASGTVQNKLIAEGSWLTPKGDNLDGLREFVRG